MLSIGIFFGFFLFINTLGINAAPYEIEHSNSNENVTWNDLNKTVKTFNRSKMIMFDFSNLNNATLSLINTNENRENGSNIIFAILDKNHTLESSTTIDQNSTAIEFPIVMDSKIDIKDINISKVSPLVEIMEPIPENQTASIIDGTIEFDQIVTSLEDLVTPLENKTLNDEQTAEVNTNVTGEFFPIASSLLMNRSNIFEMHSLIKLVSIESSNDSCLASDVFVLEASVRLKIR